MHNDLKEILISNEKIVERCDELAASLADYYGDSVPIVVGLLKGSVPFMAELIKHFDFDVEIDFMDVSSYEGTESTGAIKIIKDLDRSITGKKILLVEDIIDTGRTLKTVKELMFQKGATDVKICCLLNKQERRQIEIKADYVGFEVPNKFVVGFGLDFNEKYRNLPYIGVLKDELYL